MDQYFTKKNIMIGAVVLVVVIIIIVVVKMKKEKFVLNGSGFVAASGTAATPMAPLTYLTADASGNLSTTADGSFANISATGGVYLNGYAGNVGDVIVSNGVSTPPVWAPPLTGDIQKGYQIFPGGLIMQWGNNPGIGNKETALFPIPFPNACLSFQITVPGYTGSPVMGAALDKTKFYTWANLNIGGTNFGSAIATNWFALGY